VAVFGGRAGGGKVVRAEEEEEEEKKDGFLAGQRSAETGGEASEIVKLAASILLLLNQ
jgi:hypothetical protein